MQNKLKKITCLILLTLPLVSVFPSISFAKSTNSQEAKKTDIVYATRNGKKFHKAGCRFIKNRETISMSEKEAIAKGLLPCSRCCKEASQAKQ